MQDIRGISPTTHAQQCVQNIILNIIPKYIYNQHLIHFNISSVQKNTGFQITDIEYEFNYVNLSSSKRDEDLNSEFDKFESFLIKTDEALYLQNKVNCESAMQVLDLMYGQPGDEQEIDFYLKSLSSDGTVAVNSFQKDLVFNLFYKFFGDVNSINSINLRDYIKLIIYARRILEMSGMVLLPYLISSKITRLATRKSINKKEMVKITSSPLYSQIQAKYRNEKVEKHILSIIAIAMSSDFKAIDPFDNEVNGKMISIVPELLIEEVLLYITLI
jgi:hypothetical protein